jgi:histidyl-tRNA synthetase
VRLNSVGCPTCRKDFRAILRESLIAVKDELCAACVERTDVNPLRIFDCKECGDVKGKLPAITDNLCGECRDHFERLKVILSQMGMRYTVDPLLVRGLDYYTKTAFEILHPGLGAQNALCGGGRYDGLAEECGGASIPAVGFSAGMERLIETLPPANTLAARARESDVYVVVLDEASSALALSVASQLRDGGLAVLVDLSQRNLRKQLKASGDSGCLYSVIVGLSELEAGMVALKNMKTAEQRAVPAKSIISFIEMGSNNG